MAAAVARIEGCGEMARPLSLPWKAGASRADAAVRTLSLAEKAVIIGDVRLSGKLAQFYGDHEPDLQAPLTGLALSILLPAALAVAGLHLLLG